MPTYTVQLPDGRTMKAEAPDEKTAIDGAQKWFASRPKPAAKGPLTPPLYVPDGAGGETAIQGPEREAYNRQAQEQGQAEQKAKAERIGNRGYAERALDTAAFAGSVIPRTLTRGEYGLGDLVPGAAGDSVNRAERDFIEANQGMLESAAATGERLAGVPALSTMGAPLKAVGATLGAMRASPRGTAASAIRGTGEALEGVSRKAGQVAGDESGALRLPVAVGRAGRDLQSYAASIQPRQPRQTPNPPQMSGLPENIQTIPEKLRDIQAFRELNMQPFAPATGSKGTAGYARTIEEMPIIGGTVKSPKTDIEIGSKGVQESLARELGSRGSEEGTGAMVQSALERYRTKGITDIDPRFLRRQGIDPYQPTRPQQALSGDAARRLTDPDIAAARAAEGGGTAQTGRGATVPAARPLNQVGLRRTNAEDLSEADLNRLIRLPSNETSFAVRSEALYESAHKKMPPIMRRDGSRNPNMLATPNTANALEQTIGEVGNQLGAGQNTVFGGLAQRLINSRTNFSFDGLRAIRTEVGRALSNFGEYEQRLDRSQLNRIYGAISKDMEAGLVDIANRSWQRTRLDRNSPDYLSPDMARRADAALYEFRRADRYFRQGMGRMERFMNVLGAKTPNEAARKIATALKEKTANPQMLRELSNALRPEELNSLRGFVIENLGSGRPGSKAAESIFNFNNWATDFNAIMSGPGREFMTRGLPSDIAKKWDNLARVVNRMKYYEQTTNYSRSGYTALIGAGAVGIVNPSSIGAIITGMVGMGLSGKLLTSRPYLAWQEALMRAQLKAGNTAASNVRILGQYVKRLPALAKAQRGDVELQRALTSFGLAIEEQLKGQQTEKARALPAPVATR